METEKRKYNAKRALVMSGVFTIIAYIMLYKEPFSSSIVNISVFIVLVTTIDFTVHRILKKRRKVGDDE